jgi:hypothetical protein
MLKMYPFSTTIVFFFLIAKTSVTSKAFLKDSSFFSPFFFDPLGFAPRHCQNRVNFSSDFQEIPYIKYRLCVLYSAHLITATAQYGSYAKKTYCCK